MKGYRTLTLALAMCLVLLEGLAHADTMNLLANGGFDSGITGWTDYNTKVTWLNSTTSTSGDGASISFNGPGWFSTNPTASLVAGQTYKLSLLAKLLYDNGNAIDETLYAKVGKGSSVYIELTPTLTNTWTQYSAEFTATGSLFWLRTRTTQQPFRRRQPHRWCRIRMRFRHR